MANFLFSKELKVYRHEFYEGIAPLEQYLHRKTRNRRKTIAPFEAKPL
ncbi:MAG: hypothetical protein ACJAZY_003148 [Spirosomataceae bacterium]|jgi:hypothetical protein